MPIESYRVERRIYLAEYVGSVTVEEMNSGNMQRLAEEYDETDYIAIVDASELGRVPFDIRRLRSMDTNYSARHVLIVRPPVLLAILVDAMSRIVTKQFTVVETRDEAIEQARQMRDTLLPD